MEQTTWVINVLDDSNNRSIEYLNRLWLRKNVEKMNIRVCIEDCSADIFDIAEQWEKAGTMLIQYGRKVGNKAGFQISREALLLLKQEEGYLVFLYLPQE